MGLLDHNKRWRFKIKASPEACQRAFEQAVAPGSGMKIRGVTWSLRREEIMMGDVSSPCTIATYEGRAGVMGGLTVVAGRRAQEAEAGAVGTQLVFVAKPEGRDSTQCVMWVRNAGTTWGFTNDAGYVRSYMVDAERNLRQLDRSLILDKV